MQKIILNTSCDCFKVFKKIYVIPFRTCHSIPPFLQHAKSANPRMCFVNENYKFIYNTKYTLNFERYISASTNRPSKEKTKVEETVQVLKEEHKKKNKAVTITSAKAVTEVPAKKRSIGKRIIDELIHYYHGFRLLFINVRVSSRLVWKVLNGTSLSRRENKQLVRTVADIFRLVPFSIFIIIPFMEFLLPVFLKFFPQMLPSTFQTKSDKEKKFKAELKLKIEMAKFLQDTLDDLSLHSKGEHHSNTAKDFALFFEKVRSSGHEATNEEILKFSKLFEDELTLDNLPRPSLVALCRLLELKPIGTNNFLRFQLRMRLRNLKADDQLIQDEGLDALSVTELQAACRARGMRALGVPESRLRSQLESWLELSLNEQIPPSLLLLSRALYLPENLPAPDQLKVTLSSLPDTAATEAKYKIGEREGKVDNKTKLELIRKEEAAIKKEAEEMVQEKLDKEKAADKKSKEEPLSIPAPEILSDKAPVLEDKAVTIDEADQEKEFSKEDIDDLEDALENISNEKKKMLIEKEEIEVLKGEMADYKEDIEELKDVVLETGHKELRESKAAARLSSRVNKMISKMDKLLDDLSEEKENLQLQIEDKIIEDIRDSAEKDDIISINELVLAIRRIQKVSDDTKLQRIAEVLDKMDVDKDGAVKVDHVLKVIELLGKENVKVNSKQMDELIALLMKEDSIESKEKIPKQKLLEENVSQRKTGKE